MVRRAAYTAALALAGCVGNIGDGGDNSGTSIDPLCSELTLEERLGPSPLRRLTRRELNNTFEQILGDTSSLADALPEDDRVGPFESNTLTSVTDHTVLLYADIADTLATRAVQDLSTLLPCDPVGGEDPCAESFVRTMGRRLYRRPLSDEEVARLAVAYQVGKAEESFANGIRLALTAMLQSPFFLYRIELGVPGPSERVVELDRYELATRLASYLWQSAPDDELLDAAESGALGTAEGRRAQAERLLASPRADAAIQSFYLQLMELESSRGGLAALEKNTELFPSFDGALAAAMGEEMRLFVSHVYRDGAGTLEELFTAPMSYVNADLALLYGVEPPSDGFAKTDLDPSQRAGILTMPGVLAVHAGYSQTSPTLRGKLVRNTLMCDVTPPPPPNVNDVLPAQEDGQTKRDQLEAHVTDPSCRACHERMDPIGFGFENYDPIGAFRLRDGDVPIDPTGEVLSADDVLEGTFDGPVELARKLAASPQVQECLTRQWARFALGRRESDKEAECSFEPVYRAFEESGFDLRRLLTELVSLEAFRYRRIPNEEGE